MAKGKISKSRVFDGIEQGNCDLVTRYLKDGGDPNIKDEGIPLIHWALQKRQFEIASLLIQHGADAQSTDSNGTTVLAQACWDGDLEMVSFLLKQGVGTDARSKHHHGATALMHACMATRGDVIGVMKSLLSAGASLNARDDRGRTPLMYVCEAGPVESESSPVSDPQRAATLFEQATKLMAQASGSAITALAHLFGSSSSVEIRSEQAMFLIRAGADLDAKDRLGKTALFECRYRHQEALEKLLHENGASWTPEDEALWRRADEDFNPHDYSEAEQIPVEARDQEIREDVIPHALAAKQYFEGRHNCQREAQLTETLLGKGAKHVWVQVELEEIPTLMIIELPQNPGERKRLFDVLNQAEREYQNEESQDHGQHYEMLNLVMD